MICVENLSYTYAGASRPSVHDVSFTVAKGEVFGFLGPSGAGKSTTQKILTRLARGFQGRVSVMDRALDEWGMEYFQNIGVSFESPTHFLKLTARENLEYFKSLYSGPCESVETVLGWVGLDQDADKRVGEFSKGMKNRLSFARSLLHRPSLWFLDEPTSGLDPVNARNVSKLVRDRSQQGITTFLTTHDMHVANTLCDRVAFMVDGEIKLVDDPDSLRKQYGQRDVTIRYDEDGVFQEQTFGLDTLAHNHEFQRLIRETRVETMHSQETSLEDVFVQVTGRSLQT